MNPVEIREVPPHIQDRWQTVSRTSWSAANAFASVIVDIPNPFTTLFHTTTGGLYTNAPLARYVSNFRRFRSDVEYKITVQGNQNAYGTLMVAVSPDKSGNSMACYFADPNKVFISANDPGSVSIFCPWTESTYLIPNDAGMNPIARFRIFVLQVLKNASTTAVPCTILVEARPRNMKVMRPSNNVVYQSKEALKEAKNVGMGDMLSAGAKSLGKVAFKAIKAGAGAINPLIPMALDLLPFDRPVDPANLMRTVEVDTDIVSQVTGSTVSRRLGLAPVLPIPAIPRPDQDDYSKFDTYKKIWTSVAWFDVGATAVDTSLLNIPVAPTFTRHQANLTTPARTLFEFGPLQWLAWSHAAWRGGLEYRLLIACPEGANFQMRVTNEVRSPANLSSADSGNVFNLLIDVKGNTVVDFLVPYQGSTPYLPNPPRPELSIFDNQSYCENYLHFTKVTDVVSPFATAVIPSVHVMVRGADDFEVLWPLSGRNFTGVTYQSKEVQPLFGAEVVSADAVSLADKIDNWNDFYKMGVPAAEARIQPWVPSHLRHTFAGYRGSTRWIVQPVSDGWLTLSPPATVDNREGPYLTPLKGTDWQAYEVPYTYFTAWSPTWHDVQSNINSMRIAGNIGALQVVSFTDDLQLFFPATGPTMTILTTVPN